MTSPQRTSAIVRRVMPARPEVVYDEWLNPDALAEWMCPRPARATKILCEAWVGGELRIEIDELGTAMTVTGRYLEMERPHVLRFTWFCTTWAPSDLDSVVTVTFEPLDSERTLMTIEHSMLPPSLLGSHERGWILIADQLTEVLERGRLSHAPGGK